MSPDHAKAVAQAGWKKEDVQEFLHSETRLPVRLFKNTEVLERIKPECRWVLEAPDDQLVPVVASPDRFRVIVVGGAGGKSSFTTGIGNAITKKIEL
jgi:hypothetical protein